MTAILLQRSKDSYTCICCGRLAIGVGIYEPKKTLVAWVCSDDACVITAKGLIDMKQTELIACERRACQDAAAKVMEPILVEVMTAMWDSGVRDLSAATPDQITAALAKLAAPMTGQVEAALIAFGASIKQQMDGGDAPF